jgi:hypothetical protein
MERSKQEQMLNDIAIKTAKIEVHLENQKETLRKIEESLSAVDTLKKDVNRHGVIIKSFSWFFGIIVSLFTAKMLGKI